MNILNAKFEVITLTSAPPPPPDVLNHVHKGLLDFPLLDTAGIKLIDLRKLNKSAKVNHTLHYFDAFPLLK